MDMRFEKIKMEWMCAFVEADFSRPDADNIFTSNTENKMLFPG